MRILVITWDGGGNGNPTVELSRRLRVAGHEVTAFGPSSLADRFGADEVAYVVRSAADEWDPRALAIDARAAIGDASADVVVVDYMMPAALSAAVAIERPVVAVVHTLYGALLVEGAPSPMSMATTVDGLNAARHELGLQRVDRLADALDECRSVMVAVPAELDADLEHRTPNVRYVGPLLEGPGPDEGWRPPFVDERPLVVVSLGSTPMGQVPAIQSVLDGLAGAPVRVLAMAPPHVDPGVFVLPANAAVVGYVRHAAVMPYAAAVVSHAGLGTVVAALAHGLPQVCVPLGREQPDNAAAVVRVGAGVVVPPEDVVERIADAVVEVLEIPSYRAAATRLEWAIGGDVAGFDAVEVVTGAG
ncbi:MAG: glycosyltransferase family 1 protein [Acidimicrobiia bacterium]|nr:glycosyltransferase family 1 protein [Acidimicrobiia bacterium]